MNGNLIIVSAPSGAGKTTLVNEVFRRDVRVKPSISYTTRAPRPGEEDGVHYHFVSNREFDGMIERGEFLEWAVVHGNLYGTSRSQVEQLRANCYDVILTIDVQGAEQARRFFPDAIGVFIMPPSAQVLLERLDLRGVNSAEDLGMRMRNSLDELAQYTRFNYVVINDDLDRATEELAAIVMAERCALKKRAPEVEEILKTFTKL